MKKTKILILAECAIMLGLATALSFVRVWKMPMGGSVTLLSMLPVILISIKYGVKTGLPVAFLYSLIHLSFDLGYIMTWGMTPAAVAGIIALDYVIPFTGLGLAGFLRKKSTAEGTSSAGGTSSARWCAGISAVMVLRFLCHFMSGIIIFSQWAWEGWNVALFSLAYNGSYMLPELCLTAAGALVLLKTPYVRKMFNPV